MLIEESYKRQAELKKLLYEMAETCMDETQIRQSVLKFKVLYSDGFRHSYSEFFPLILDIARDNSGYNLDYLSNNLEMSRALVEKDYVDGEKEFRGLYKPLSKLSDHINLEIGRYSYYTINEQTSKGLEKKNEALLEELKQAKKEIKSISNSTRKKLQETQKEYISILGIFASIVLSFTAILTFTSSVLENVHKASVYRTVLVSLVIGLVLVNVIYALFYYINRIVHGADSSSFVPLLISNVVFVALILGVFAAWHFGWVEGRNERIVNSVEVTTIIETTLAPEPPQTTFVETTAIVTTE